MIEAFCKQFFGYGRWDAPVWFVGIEEAGAGTPEELQARLLAWDQRGRRELEDAPVFYPACGQPQWHGPNASLQRTWRQLMRMLLLARGEPVEEDALLEYQKHTLGAFPGHVCLTELSPLPAPNHLAWPYANRLDLPAWVRSREQFMQTVAAGRIATLREKIALHHPRAVVFYFWKHRQSAEAVAGGEFRPVIPEQLLGLKRNGMAYFITGHPAARYLPDPDAYFAGLGRYFHEHCRDLFAIQQVSLLQKAIAIAAAAHHWQKRKQGSPYVLHPLRMACALKTEAEQIVAVLHDVVEDTHWTFDDLRREGFPDDILQALDCVTERKGESYDDFLTRAASNPIARRVKLADLEDNMNVRDLPEVTPKDALRLSKYVKAWHRLSET
jgi:hypothetical protein